VKECLSGSTKVRIQIKELDSKYWIQNLYR